MRTTLLLLCVLATSACNSVPRGGASELHVEFGVAPVFSVAHDNTGITSDGTTIKAASGKTSIQILLFKWMSFGKDIVLSSVP